jgi:hypothetical protein
MMGEGMESIISLYSMKGRDIKQIMSHNITRIPTQEAFAGMGVKACNRKELRPASGRGRPV